MKSIILVQIVIIGVMSGCGSEAPPERPIPNPNSPSINWDDRGGAKSAGDEAASESEKSEPDSDSVDPDEKGGAKQDGKD